MVVEYIADTSKLVSGVQNVKQAAEDGASSLRNLATGAAVVAATALIGVGVASTKMAGDFQSSMTALETGANESSKNIKMVSDGILDMAPKVGETTKQLADGMYMIESAGFHGAAALTILKDAAEGAKVGNADLETTAQAVTGIMLNYKDANITAAQAVNDLVATVGDGQVHMQDLALAMATVEPIAAKSGISLADVSAAMATMTAKTIPAADAATYLRQTIMAIENPTTKAKDAMASLGLKSSDVANEMKKSLPDALQMITDAAAKKFPVGSAQYIAAIANMVGGTKSMQGIMNLTGSDMAAFKANVEDISGKIKTGGDNISGWAKVQQDFNQKMDQAKATMEVLGIKIGTALLPALSKLVDGFSSPAFQQFATVAAGALTTALLALINGVSTLVQWGTQLVAFFQHNQAAMATLQVVAATLAGAIGGALAVAFGMGAAAAASTAIAFLSVAWPVILIVAAIAGLVVGLVLLYQRFAPVREVLNAVGQMFVQVWNILVQSFMPAWNQLVAEFQKAVPDLMVVGQILLGVLVVAIGVVIAVVVGLAEGIAAAMGGIVQIITGAVQIIHGVLDFFGGIFLFIMDLITGRFDQLVPDLQRIGSGIVNIFVGLGNAIAGVFVALGGFVGGFFVGFIQGIIGFFQHLFDVLVGHSIIPDMVNGIISWFLQLPGRAGAAIQSMITNVLNLLNGLVSSALQVGSNIVNNIAQGIRNAIGAVGNAITAVTNFISAHLPHSPAKMGPLMDLEYQGAQISNQIAKGMVNGTPLISNAIGNMTKPITVGLKGAASASSTPLQGGVTQDNSVHVYIDGKEVTGTVMKRVQKELRGHGLKK